MSKNLDQGLTARERQVAALVRDGLTDREIAERLFIARRTAEWHVKQIFNKLGFSSRAQVAAWVAHEQALHSGVASPDEHRHNLPLQLTTFVGRATELLELERLLETKRLVTLTATSGAGKTRLALEVATRALDAYSDGAWFVDLTPIKDGQLVARAFGTALGVHEQPREPIDRRLMEHLRTRRTLLVVDNCEHVIDDCAALVNAILQSCPGVTVLATSREALRVSGETVRRVGPLAVPDPAARIDLDELARSEAVGLFLDRAKSVAPGFEIGVENAPPIAELCRRLDGIPLAIELAAARASLMSPEQMLSRLEDRFGLLTGGARTGPARHRSLLAALAWSDDLLSDNERVLFRRLAVFVGSFSLEAAEQICSLDDLEGRHVADLLASLVDKSLVVTVDPFAGPIRFRLLETIREYGWMGLQQSGDVDRLSQRHCEFFVSFTAEAFAKIRTAEQYVWRNRVVEELSNIRSAFYWALDHASQAALQLAWALNDFWVIHGMFLEGESWFDRALNRYKRRDDVRARGLAEGGWLAWHQDDLAGATVRWNECLDIYRELGDVRGIGQALVLTGNLAVWRGDLSPARELYEQGLALSRQADDAFWIAGALRFLGQLDLREQDAERARVHLEESLAWNDRIGEPRWRSYTLLPLALCAIDQGDWAAARSNLEGYAAIARQLEFMYGEITALAGFAALAAAQSDPGRALRLVGASQLLSESIGIGPFRFNRAPVERWVETSRRQLSPEQTAAFLAEGRAMSKEQALEYALEG
ncbi:MAG TPA: LuxR C-terminal-related transcriptional regulator [Chloroflexota bacterium]